MLINLPLDLEKNEIELIKISYKDASGNITDENFRYIKKHFKKKKRLLNGTGVRWHLQMSAVARVFFEIIDKDLILFVPEISNKIASALLYLCEPFDVIPDHTPERGLVDDALVLNYCLNDIMKYDKKSYDIISDRIVRYFDECN